MLYGPKKTSIDYCLLAATAGLGAYIVASILGFQMQRRRKGRALNRRERLRKVAHYLAKNNIEVKKRVSINQFAPYFLQAMKGMGIKNVDKLTKSENEFLTVKAMSSYTAENLHF